MVVSGHEPVVLPASTSDCTLQAVDFSTFVGVNGEQQVVPGGWSVEAPVPTHYAGNHERVQFSKNRTRTNFLRRMLVYYQPYFIIFRGKERNESAPICSSVGRAYYVYALRRLLC